MFRDTNVSFIVTPGAPGVRVVRVPAITRAFGAAVMTWSPMVVTKVGFASSSDDDDGALMPDPLIIIVGCP